MDANAKKARPQFLHIRMHMHTHKFTRTHKLTHIHAYKFMRTHSAMHADTRARAHASTLAHTETQSISVQLLEIVAEELPPDSFSPFISLFIHP